MEVSMQRPEIRRPADTRTVSWLPPDPFFSNTHEVFSLHPLHPAALFAPGQMLALHDAFEGGLVSECVLLFTSCLAVYATSCLTVSCILHIAHVQTDPIFIFYDCGPFA